MPLRGSGCPGLGESAADLQSFWGVNTLCARTRWGPRLAEAVASGEKGGRMVGGRAPGVGATSEPDVAAAWAQAELAPSRRVAPDVAAAAAWGRGPRLLTGKHLVKRRRFGVAPRLPWGPQYPEKQAQIAPSALPAHPRRAALYVVFRGRASRRTDGKWR